MDVLGCVTIKRSQTCLKRQIKRRQKKGFSRLIITYSGQKYCRMLPRSILQYFRPALSNHLSKTFIIPPAFMPRGYIVFVFPFVCSFVRSFVLPSVAWNLRQSFALKFLKWCISQQLLIRKHSYLDHSYPGGLAVTP